MSQQREQESGLSEDQLVKVLQLKRYEAADKEQLLRNRQNIMRKVRSIQAVQKSTMWNRLKAYWGEICTEPKYGLAVALIFLFFAFMQVIRSDRAHSERSAAIDADLRGLAVEDLPLDEAETYPDLPAHIRLFAPPTGGDGTVLPATFEVE